MPLELRRCGEGIGQKSLRRQARHAVQAVGNAPADDLDGEMTGKLLVGGHGYGGQCGRRRRIAVAIAIGIGSGQDDGDGRPEDGRGVVVVAGRLGVESGEVRTAVDLSVEVR